MDISLRRRTLELSQDRIKLDSMCRAVLEGSHPEPNTLEAQNFLEETKPIRFASLGFVIADMLAVLAQKQEDQPPHGISSRIIKPGTPLPSIGLLYMAMRATLDDCTQEVINKPEHEMAQRIAELGHKLDKTRHSSLLASLNGGNTTSSWAIAGLIASLPDAIKAHLANATTEDIFAIARQSQQLPARLALLSIDSMHSAGAVLSGNWEQREQTLQVLPKYTRPVPSSETIKRIDFVKLGSLALQEDWSAFPTITSIPRTKPGDTVTTYQPSSQLIIGCPLTLLHGGVNTLWQWALDIAEHDELIGAS